MTERKFSIEEDTQTEFLGNTTLSVVSIKDFNTFIKNSFFGTLLFKEQPAQKTQPFQKFVPFTFTSVTLQ